MKSSTALWSSYTVLVQFPQTRLTSEVLRQFSPWICGSAGIHCNYEPPAAVVHKGRSFQILEVWSIRRSEDSISEHISFCCCCLQLKLFAGVFRRSFTCFDRFKGEAVAALQLHRRAGIKRSSNNTWRQTAESFLGKILKKCSILFHQVLLNVSLPPGSCCCLSAGSCTTLFFSLLVLIGFDVILKSY